MKHFGTLNIISVRVEDEETLDLVCAMLPQARPLAPPGYRCLNFFIKGVSASTSQTYINRAFLEFYPEQKHKLKLFASLLNLGRFDLADWAFKDHLAPLGLILEELSPKILPWDFFEPDRVVPALEWFQAKGLMYSKLRRKESWDALESGGLVDGLRFLDKVDNFIQEREFSGHEDLMFRYSVHSKRWPEE